jgi:hypothetical protein
MTETPSFDGTGGYHDALMHQGGLPESYIVGKEFLKTFLVPGENVLSVQVHTSSSSPWGMSSNVFFFLGIKNDNNYYGVLPSWFVPPVELTSSNLPIVKISTPPFQHILYQEKITADLNIINNNGSRNQVSEQGNDYSGKIGIEIRGKYSAILPQKPFGFETRDALGNNLNTPLIGMPEENDWILLANYNDKVFLRNYLAFDIFHKMGHYATRSRLCEVVLNDDYQGIYLLVEKIKQDKNRVNIAKLKPDENSGDNLTGGYIFKTDYYGWDDSWVSNFSPLNKPGADIYFVYHDPKPDEITDAQKNYLKDYVNQFEKTLYSSSFTDVNTGYRAYIDVNSFVDYFILGEVTRSVDAYKKSRYFYKDKDSKNKLIHSGPPWDFDWAWKDIRENCIHVDQTDGSGWAYRINECDDWPVAPSWEVKLLQDETFADKIHDRYFQLRKSVLSQTYLNHVIDSVANFVDEAQARHYTKWPILGFNVGTGEYGDQPLTYSGEVEKFKSWISRRLTWLDNNMIGNPSEVEKEYHAIMRIFPNPASEYIRIESDTNIMKVKIYNIMGVEMVYHNGIWQKETTIDISDFAAGIYIVRVTFEDDETITRKIVKKQ